jgi:hypothetical protein
MNNSAKEIYEQFDDFIAQLIGKDLELQILIEVNAFDKPAQFYINFHGVDVFDKEFASGTYLIQLNLKQSLALQTLRFGMRNKEDNETIVDNGQIIKDKFIVLKQFKLNNYLLTDDYDFMYNKLQYVDTKNNVLEDVKFGFWKNCYIEMQFTSPFDLYYNNFSNLNQNFAESLKFRNNNYDITNTLIESLKKLD